MRMAAVGAVDMVGVMRRIRPHLPPQPRRPPPHQPQADPRDGKGADGCDQPGRRRFGLIATPAKGPEPRSNQTNRHRRLRQTGHKGDHGQPDQRHPARHAVAADHQLAVAGTGGMQKSIGKTNAQKGPDRAGLPPPQAANRTGQRGLNVPLRRLGPMLQRCEPAKGPQGGKACGGDKAAKRQGAGHVTRASSA